MVLLKDIVLQKMLDLSMCCGQVCERVAKMKRFQRDRAKYTIYSVIGIV